MGPFISTLINFDVDFATKYFEILTDCVVWILFDTSHNSDLSGFLPGKIITVGCMVIGLAYNVYILVQILSVISITHGSRTKYYEVMNQLDAYMQKKQFPRRLQRRLKFFYARKFRQTYFREIEILDFLSGELEIES
jgi:hypothetical protein